LKSILLFSIIFLLGKQTFSQTTYQTECVLQENVGAVTFRIWDRKKGSFYKLEAARKDAVRAILFSGISKSSNCSGAPALLRTEKERTDFKSIEQSFFAKDGPWARFTSASTPDKAFSENPSDPKLAVFQVAVAREDLRKYLEEQKIIKSLSTGF
jgi:hypothetical protein